MTRSGCTLKRLPMMSGARMCPSTCWMSRKATITHSAASGEWKSATIVGGTAASTGPT